MRYVGLATAQQQTPAASDAHTLNEPMEAGRPSATAGSKKKFRRVAATAMATTMALVLLGDFLARSLGGHGIGISGIVAKMAMNPCGGTVAPTQQPGAPPVAAASSGDLPPTSPVAADPYEPILCENSAYCGGSGVGQTAWYQDPQALAGQVGDLSSMPGVGGDAFASVKAIWSNAPPKLPSGKTSTWSSLASFVTALLMSNPYGTGQYLPYVDLHTQRAGKVVGISQRQLAYNVANVLMGNDVAGSNGLSAALRRCTQGDAATDIVFALLSMLAVLSEELEGGYQGTMVVAAAPNKMEWSWPQVMAQGAALQPPNIVVKVRGHEKYSDEADFMTGDIPLQALTDIAGGNVGGGAGLCRVANSQDESLMQFYPEVLAFAFYLRGDGMLQSPMTFLGTRRYLNQIEGDTTVEAPYFARCGNIPEENWLNMEIVKARTSVPVGNRQMDVASSAFVAVQSAMVTGGTCAVPDMVNNNCDPQRRHLDKDIGHWYAAFEASAYNPAVQNALHAMIRRIGTGPWGAGAWYGDSQQYFLAVWLATALLSNPPRLDYYVYDQFCENPGNQCFVLGSSSGCAECVAKTGKVDASRCGDVDLWSMVTQWQGQPAQALFQTLNAVGPPPAQVFDLMR